MLKKKFYSGAQVCDIIFEAVANADVVERIMRRFAVEPSSPDAVEVVRCKDCKEWQTDWEPSNSDGERYFCCAIDKFPKGDFFCAFGERKEKK